MWLNTLVADLIFLNIAGWWLVMDMDRVRQDPQHAREIVVYGFPEGTSIDDLKQHFNMIIKGFGASSDKEDAVYEVRLSKMHATIEFYKILQATAAFGIHGINSSGYCLYIQRPQYYKPLDFSLKYQRKMTYMIEDSRNPDMDTREVWIRRIERSSVIYFVKLIPVDDLKDSVIYERICSSITLSMSQYGIIEAIEIPRRQGQLHVPAEGNAYRLLAPVPGEGNVYIRYRDPQTAEVARNDVHGRLFNEIVIMANFYSVNKFVNNEF